MPCTARYFDKMVRRQNVHHSVNVSDNIVTVGSNYLELVDILIFLIAPCLIYKPYMI